MVVRIEEQSLLGGRYRLTGRIAAGGMGSVWRAEDEVLHRPVAVKILSDALGQDAKFVERFRREARAAAGLSHPNVAGVYDYGEEHGLPFIVMELLEGETLAHRLAGGGPMPAGEAARISGQVAEALQAAHDAGVVHRDVKPANIMLTRRGEVKVMDFGIAASSGAAPLTAAGTTMGTASYLSPEQAGGERATPVSDVYALGCVLYEMLTGRPPFTGENPVAVAGAHLHDRPVPVRELAPDVPPHIAEAVDLALSKDPAERPGSARLFGAMVTDLEASTHTAPIAAHLAPPGGNTLVLPAGDPTVRLAGTTPAQGSPLPSPPARRRRRAGPVLWFLLAVLAAVAVLGVVLAAVTGNSPKPKDRPSAQPTSVQVPNVVGLPFDQAAATLRAADLVPVAQPVKGEQGIVLGVRPDEGTTVSRGDSITVYVGNGDEGHGNDEDHGGGNDNKGKGNGDGH